MEDWKWIEGYEGLYKIFRDGRVLSVDRYDKYNRLVGGFLKPQRTGSRRDYWFVGLMKDGKLKRYYIHRLVALAFIPNPEHKRCVDHIDNDKSNNNVENLRWVTHKENMNNVITRKKMLDESYKYISQAGTNNPFSRKIAMYSLDGSLIGEFDSAGQIEKQYGIRSASISRVCYGQRNQTHGYVFRFINEAKRKLVHKPASNVNRKPIVQLDLEGNIVAEYNSAHEAAQMTGFLSENIGRAAKGLYKSYKGYKWRYK